MDDGPRKMLSRRMQAGVSTVLVVAASLTACGGDSQGDEPPTLDVGKIEATQAPAEYTRVTNVDRHQMSQIASNPVPPGFNVYPSQCSPAPAAVPPSAMSSTKVVAFRSQTAVMSLVAYDAGSDVPFGAPECENTTITGPEDFEVMTVPANDVDIAGADKTRGSHSVVRENRGAKSYSQYTYVAQVAKGYRVVVFLTPLLNERGEQVLPVDPADATEVLQNAVRQLVPS